MSYISTSPYFYDVQWDKFTFTFIQMEFPHFMHCVTLTQKPPDEVTPLVSKTVIEYYQEPFSPTSHLNVITAPLP